jgi:hypothetical protein
MAKYTIETDGNTADDIGGYLGIRIEICNKRTWVKTDMELTPCTEPDLDAIRNEAYEKGVQDTKQHWVDAPRSCAYKLGYENGLNDAWEAARKICTNWVLPDSVLSEIFGMDKTIDDIMKENTASEVIEKIRQYEQGQEEQDGLRQNIQTIVDQCGYTLDEIAEVLKEMRKDGNRIQETMSDDY